MLNMLFIYELNFYTTFYALLFLSNIFHMKIVEKCTLSVCEDLLWYFYICNYDVFYVVFIVFSCDYFVRNDEHIYLSALEWKVSQMGNKQQ